jgi:hypothetical protein
MFLFYVLSFFKNGDTIEGGTLFKGGYYLRKYGTHASISRNIVLIKYFCGSICTANIYTAQRRVFHCVQIPMDFLCNFGILW